MSVNLKTDCKDCIHEKVCKNHNQTKYFADRLQRINYGDGPNDDYSWDTMSDHYHVNIDISCKDFEQAKPVPRTSFPGKYQGPGVR